MREVCIVVLILTILLALIALVAILIRRPAASGQFHIYYEVARALDGSPIVCYLVGQYSGGEDLNVGQRVTNFGFHTYEDAIKAATECANDHQRDVALALKSIADPATYLPDPRPIQPRTR